MGVLTQTPTAKEFLMAIDPDKLFDILDKGFDHFDKTMTDKSRRIEQRMDKMRERIEARADDIRKRTEDNADALRHRLDKRLAKLKDYDFEDSGIEGKRKVMKQIVVMALVPMLLIFVMLVIFLFTSLDTDKVSTSPKLSPPPIEEPSQPDQVKKL